MISFELSAEQKMLVETAAKFARERVRPLAREADESGLLPPDLLESAWQLGFIPGSIPEAHGGFGERSAVSGALFVEELACGDLSFAFAAMAPALVAFPLLTGGTLGQRDRYLPRFAGDVYPPATAALLEPCYQFDPSQLATTAKRA